MAGWLPSGVTQGEIDRAIEGGCPDCGKDPCECWPLDDLGNPIPPDLGDYPAPDEERQGQPLTNPQGGLDFMANETEQQKAEREKKEKEQREKERRDREQKKEAGEEEERVGEPMREDDRQNQFRAPDVKPLGAFYGEDTTQPRAIKPEEIGGLPPETHPQKPAKEAEPEEEDKQTVSRR